MRKARDGKQRAEKGAKGDRFSGAQYRGKGQGDVLGTSSKFEPFAYVELGKQKGAAAFAGVMASTTKAGKAERRRGSLKKGIVAERSGGVGGVGGGSSGGGGGGGKKRERE